jgi:protein-S-isoprenylcysteine O-methyltransferase Ste14
VKPTLRGLGSAFGNLSLACVWGLFAYAHVQDFLEFFRLSVLLIVMKESLDVLFYLTRPSARSFSRSPYAWITALGGTFTPLLLRPSGSDHDLLVGQLLLCFGITLQFVGMLSLDRSIGIVPANRGSKTSGLYRYIRHPLYLAYIITWVGYLVSNATLHNALVVAAASLFQILRIYDEERFLCQDPAYEAFAKRTRWALVPYVF